MKLNGSKILKPKIVQSLRVRLAAKLSTEDMENLLEYLYDLNLMQPTLVPDLTPGPLP